MTKVCSANSATDKQASLHYRACQVNSMLPGPVNIPGSLSAVPPHPAHLMQLAGPHEREHSLTPVSGSIPAHYFPAMGVNPNSPHHLPNMIPHGHPHFHHPNPFIAFNRIPHFIGQPELRIFEMNKRLQQRMEDCDSVWWEAFVSDFFEDDATLTIGFMTEDGPKRYTIGRTLIARYFRSIFESGCGELYFNLRLNHEYFHNPFLTLDSEAATMTMNMMRTIPATVVIEGRLTLEFALDELLRIRSWIFLMRSHREMIMRSMLGIQDPVFLDQLTKNITRYGMTPNTLNFFRLCVILEPMQELMSRQKAYSLAPRDCLKTTLFQKWRCMMPQEATRQPSKRRKRKGSAANEGGSTGSSSGRGSKRKQSPVPMPPHHIAQPGDVMIVGEPTLMGGDFGDEDERLITRLENTQYDAAANILMQGSHMHPGFHGPSESPNLVSSPMGMNAPLNCGPHPLSGAPFRGGAIGSGGPSSHQMNPNDSVYANNVPPISPHPSGVPVAMSGSQQLSAGPSRFAPHNTIMIPQQQQQCITVLNKSGAVNSSRDIYPNPSFSGPPELMHHPVRSNSASSLIDAGGFPTCGSPGMLPSRPPARFTPPGLPNGVMGQAPVSQSNFLIPSELSGPNSMNQMPIPGTTLCSPPTSYTPEAMDTSLAHSTQSQVPPSSSAVKSSASPLMFGCFASNTNGVQMSEPPMLAMNDTDDLKPMIGARPRSNSESL